MALFGGSDQELRVTIRAKDEASREIAKVNNSVGSLAKGFAIGTVAVDALRTGFRFLSGIVTDSIKEFEQQNLAVAQMNATLRSTQYAAGLTAKELVGMANALAETTLYTDDQVISAQNLLLTFTNITRDTFPRATQAILDMSTALGQDLSSSAIQLGKALNNPIEGVSALQRVGVSFNNAQQELIATMVKSGETIQAQQFILDELEREFGESAQSAYEAASSVTRLQKNIGELKEDIGSGLTPALNNLFAAFNSVTVGMGRNVDVGKTVFKTFAAIGEFAAATATGIHTLAASFVTLTTYVAEAPTKLMGVSTALKLLGKDSDTFFSDWREAIRDGVSNTSDFYFSLKEKNDAVLSSWGDMSDEAKVLGTIAPAAYQATAREAAAATKKVEDTRRAIIDTRRALDDYKRSLQVDTQSLAEAFVAQEQKVRDLQSELQTEQNRGGDADQKRIMELEGDIFREKSALDRARTIETQLPAEVLKGRRRAGLTDFERGVEDIVGRSVQRQQDFAQNIVLNVNFNDVVAGDQGVRDIIERTFKELNRASTLKGMAGV